MYPKELRTAVSTKGEHGTWFFRLWDIFPWISKHNFHAREWDHDGPGEATTRHAFAVIAVTQGLLTNALVAVHQIRKALVKRSCIHYLWQTLGLGIRNLKLDRAACASTSERTLALLGHLD